MIAAVDVGRSDFAMVSMLFMMVSLTDAPALIFARTISCTNNLYASCLCFLSLSVDPAKEDLIFLILSCFAPVDS